MPNSPQIQPYLYFAGRCEEAIAFYGKALGAKVDFLMHYKDSPEPMPPGMLQPGFEQKVMHATIRIGDATMMVSDGCDDRTQFDGFSLYLALPNEEEARKAFAALAEGGQVQLPLAKTFWSPCFGMIQDRFGVGWKITVASATT